MKGRKVLKKTWPGYKVIELCSIIVVCIGITGIALKFLTFQIVLNQGLAEGDLLTGLWFPYFPNVLDSLFLILGALYLALKSLRKK